MATLRESLQAEAKKYGFDINKTTDLLLFGLLLTNKSRLEGQIKFDEGLQE